MFSRLGTEISEKKLDPNKFREKQIRLVASLLEEVAKMIYTGLKKRFSHQGIVWNSFYKASIVENGRFCLFCSRFCFSQRRNKSSNDQPVDVRKTVDSVGKCRNLKEETRAAQWSLSISYFLGGWKNGDDKYVHAKLDGLLLHRPWNQDPCQSTRIS